MATVNTSDDQFNQDVIESSTPVLVDFWAEWCSPCKALAPKLDEIAQEYGERLKVCKLDVDKNKKTTVEFSIRGIPTLMLFKDGKKVEEISGNHPKENITALINKHIG